MLYCIVGAGYQCDSMGTVAVVLLLVAGVRAEVGTREVTCIQ